jgi:PKD repeat protein
VVTYSNPGTYAVTLLAGNGGGTGTLTQTALITVNAVVANFTQDVTSVCPGFSVTFANESSCSPTTIDWIFDGGDITTSTDQAPTVTYVSPGYYDVTLIAGNNSGKDTLVQNLAVQVYSTASVNAVSTDDNGNNSGTATATPVGGTPPFTFKWNDPQQQTTATATNLAAGTYNVTVTDANGCRSISSVTVLFSEPSAIDGFAKLGWSVFPNPATQVINILLDRSAEVEIYNALGQLVLSQKDMLKGLNVLEIGKWPHGVYSIKVKAGEQMAVQKVIIH